MSRRLWKLLAVIFLAYGIIISGCKKNQEKISETKILTSWLTVTELFHEFPEYELEKSAYAPEDSMLIKLDAIDKEFEVLIFMGTYCPDCKREVPRFLKIHDLLTHTKFAYRMYGLNRKQDDTSGMREKYAIEYIPTFIIYVEGKEIGRIIESPIVSIESDLYEICCSF